MLQTDRELGIDIDRFLEDRREKEEEMQEEWAIGGKEMGSISKK